MAFGGTAHADTSSWLAIGPGYAIERDAFDNTGRRAVTLSMSLGVGTSPKSKLVVGGIFRTVTYFSLGTDLGLSARFATGGFARGDWGLAFDAGIVARTWGGGNFGRYPLQPVLTAGAPWGLQVGLGAQFLSLSGDPMALGGFAVLELDLLRLTLMRQGSTDSMWFNASPAGGR